MKTKLTINDLIIGKNYHIVYQDIPSTSYTGIGKLISINPPDYPEGSCEFNLPGDEIGTGVFGIDSIISLVPDDKPISQWQSISSAPKDGTRIILFRKEWAENICIGFWSTDFGSWNIVGAVSPFLGATHWMPVPELPVLT